MAYIEERKAGDGKTRYRAQVRLKGYPIQSATFERKTDAKLWVQQTEAAMREGRHFKTAESKKHTLGELIDRYIRDMLPKKAKSFKKQSSQLKWWKQNLGHCLLSDITPAKLAEYRDLLGNQSTMRGPKRSSSTVVRYCAALSHVFSIAVKEWEWMQENPMLKVSKPQEPRGRVRFLSTEERTRLLSACRESSSPFLYAIVVLALSTGMRQAEMLNLTWQDVDLDKGRITLHETKNGERRVVPLVGHALEVIHELVEERKNISPFLFPSNRLSKNKPYQIRSAWEKAVKTASIQDFRFHDLRHSAASELAMSGASLAEIAEVLGHRTLAVTQRYSHLSDSHTSSVVERMNEKIFG